MFNLFNEIEVKKGMEFGTNEVKLKSYKFNEPRRGVKKDGTIYVTKPTVALVLETVDGKAEETHNIFLEMVDGNLTDTSKYIVSNIVKGIAEQIRVFGNMDEVLDTAKTTPFKVYITPFTTNDGKVYKNFEYNVTDIEDIL